MRANQVFDANKRWKLYLLGNCLEIAIESADKAKHFLGKIKWCLQVTSCFLTEFLNLLTMARLALIAQFDIKWNFNWPQRSLTVHAPWKAMEWAVLHALLVCSYAFINVHVESFVVCIVGKMAQNVGILWKYCGTGVIPILFGWFLRLPSIHALLLTQKPFLWIVSVPFLAKNKQL